MDCSTPNPTGMLCDCPTRGCLPLLAWQPPQAMESNKARFQSGFLHFFLREESRFHPVAYLEFLQDVCHVMLDRLLR